MAAKPAKSSNVPASGTDKAKPSSKRKPRSRGWKWFKIVSLILLLLTLLGFVGLVFYAYPTFIWAEQRVKKLNAMTQNNVIKPTTILARDGTMIYRAQSEYRQPVRYDEIPEYVIKATLAAEDERFFQHPGIDAKALGRAAVENLTNQRVSQGGSTITMQLAKRLFTSAEKSVDRKLKDIALAYYIERSKTKEEILKLYLNEVYYGSGAYGIRAAAKVYFSKDLRNLTIAECALLARLVQRPSEYNPFKNREVAIEKRNVILAKMRELDFISQAEYQAAIEEPLQLKRSVSSGEQILGSPWFVHWILNTIEKEHPEFDIREGGYTIETTFDPKLQEGAEAAVKRVVRQNRRSGVTTGAFVLMNAKGEVLAIVGGSDYQKNQFNVIWQGKRQPGSAMKPFIYTAALASGAISAYSPISNEPNYIDNPHGRGKIKWPKGGGTGGSVSLSSAIAHSINVPAVHVINRLTPRKGAAYAKSAFGFTSRLDPVPALVLGSSAVSPLELAEGYSVFMLYGDRAKPFGIRRIETPEGDILDDFGPSIVKRAVDPGICQVMDRCMRAVVMSGSGTRAQSVPSARGKTGTTSDHRDAWFCGYTNNFVGVAWVASEQFVNGKPVYRPMDGVFGGHVSIQIWTEVMKLAIDKFGDPEVERHGYLPPAPYIDTTTDDPNPDEELDPGLVPEEEYRPEPEVDPEPDQASPQPTNPDANPPVTTEPPVTNPPETNPPVETKSEETEFVQVCSESGMRANPYCPDTTTQKLSKSKIPRRCNKHGPH